MVKCLFFILVFSLGASIVTAQGYLKEFKVIAADNRETIVNLYPAENNLIEVQAFVRDDSIQIINYDVDESGNVISPVRLGAKIISGTSVALDALDTCLFFMYYDRSTLTINGYEVSKEGDISASGSFEIFGESSFVGIQSMHRGRENYVVSGSFIDTLDIRKGFVLWMDHDFNLLEIFTTSDEYNNVYSVTQDEEGRVYGLVNFINFDFEFVIFDPMYGRHYVARIDPAHGLDTLNLIQEGKNEIIFGREPELVYTDEGFLVYPYHKTTEDGYSKLFTVDCIDTSGQQKYSIDYIDVLYSRPDNPKVYDLGGGELIAMFNSSVRTDGDDRNTSFVNTIISKIDNGHLEWSRQFVRYDSLRSLGDSFWDVKEKDNFYYLFGSNNDTSTFGNPLILKIDKNGCMTEDCGRLQVYGDRPAPTHGVSSRNEWHVYDKETEERYRYTFIDLHVPGIAGTLMRSDQLTGDDWYSTGRVFSSGPSVLGERITLVEGVDRFSLSYRYDIALGDYTELDQFIWGDPRYLSVIDRDSVVFSDGREMSRLTLQCYESEAAGGGVVGEMTEIPPFTWIDYLGNPDDLFNTFNACTDSLFGSEVVTCFYSAGEMMWSHPEYGSLCTTATTKLDRPAESTPLLYPNPAQNIISLSKPIEGYRILDVVGQVLLEGGAAAKGQSIDVSMLPRGQYFLYETPFKKGSKVSGFVKMLN